jgi:hypothetical protein
MTNKDYTGAINAFSEVLRHEEGNEEAMFYRSVSLLDSG